MIGEDEYLERIVAGIHAITTSDADVSWNEVINGRQFDVVARFALGRRDPPMWGQPGSGRPAT